MRFLSRAGIGVMIASSIIACSTLSGHDACCAPGTEGGTARSSGTSFFGSAPAAHHDMERPIRAICMLHPKSGNPARGTVTFTEVDGGTRIEADVTGLAPGRHGFHIHEFGDCSAADATSAGGHFNPDSHVHGAPGSANRHPGDLGNLEADATGRAQLDVVDAHLKLRGSRSIIGRAVIVHAKEDDLVTQPTGNAGARVACGVIGIAKGE